MTLVSYPSEGQFEQTLKTFGVIILRFGILMDMSHIQT